MYQCQSWCICCDVSVDLDIGLGVSIVMALPLVQQGYYRRASANMALGKFKLALKDFEAVKKAKPRDPDAISKYNECNKIVKQQAFARAIAVEQDDRSIAETIEVEKMGKPLGAVVPYSLIKAPSSHHDTST